MLSLRPSRALLLFTITIAAACGSDDSRAPEPWAFESPETLTETEGVGGMNSSAAPGEAGPRNHNGETEGGAVPVDRREHQQAAVESICSATRLKCERMFECEFTNVTEFLGALGIHSVDGCVAFLENTAACGYSIAFERDNLTVDADAVDACLRAAVEDDCEMNLAECLDEATRPTAEDGTECYTDLECVGGVCHGAWSNDECLVERGTCGERSETGGPCEFDADCAHSLHCVAGKCAVPGGAGAACNDWRECRYELTCVGEVGAEKRCTPPLAEGEACDPRGEPLVAPCEFDAYCDTDTGTCVRRPETGDACDEDAQCLGADVTCFDGTCRRLGGVGDACDGWGSCQYRLRCLDGVCAVPHLELGAACDDDVACGSHVWCIDGRCALLPDDGEPCHEDRCAFYAECIDGVCVDDWKRDECAEADSHPSDY